MRGAEREVGDAYGGGDAGVAAGGGVARSESGALHVLPPCGVCREFLRAVDAGNLGCSVVLGRDRAVVLRELLPFWEWPGALGVK